LCVAMAKICCGKKQALSTNLASSPHSQQAIKTHVNRATQIT
jgi:hypothetical protein